MLSNDFSLNSLLMDEKQVIRIYANAAPGFGDQTASLNIIRRLRAIGYKGVFEFIYMDSNRRKIQNLFGLPDTIGQTYNNGQGLVFYALSAHLERYLNCTLPPVQLAMTGAYDISKRETQLVPTTTAMIEDWLAEDVEIYAEKNAIFINYANLMNARVFIRYSPYQVHPRHANFRHTVLHVQNNLHPITQLASTNKFLVVQPYTFADATVYLNSQKGQFLLQKFPALPALMRAYQNQHIKFMPCYGYTLLYQYSPQNLISMLAGARYAQLKSQTNYAIIVPFLADLGMLATQEIVQTLTWARSSALRAAIDSLELNSAVTVSSLYHEDAQQQISNLQPGKILLLATGPLPNVIFNALYTYAGPNLLLQVREGASSLVSLLPTGKPHLRCGAGWEVGFDDMDETLRKQFEEVSLACGEEDKAWREVDVASVVGEYILSAQDPESRLAQYFRNLSLKIQDPNNDRIVAGLNDAVKLLDKPDYEYSDMILGDYHAVVTPPLPHCRAKAASAGWLEILVISLPLIFFMLLLSRKIYGEEKIKYHQCKQTLFAVTGENKTVRETDINQQQQQYLNLHL